MTELTRIPAAHSESVVIRDAPGYVAHGVIMKLFASGDDVVVLGPDARRALAKRLLQGLPMETPADLRASIMDDPLDEPRLVTLDGLMRQMVMLREIEGGAIPMAVSVAGKDGFTTLDIGVCAPPARVPDPENPEDEVTALLICAFPHTPKELEDAPLPNPPPAPVPLESADPKELQNDGDPIKAAVTPPDVRGLPNFKEGAERLAKDIFCVGSGVDGPSMLHLAKAQTKAS